MSYAWAIRLAPADAAALTALRLADGLEIADTPGAVWLRGPPAEDALQRRLRSLPAVDRFECLPKDRLRPLDSRIPSIRLPPVRWIPIQAWLQVTLPVAALPGSVPRPVALHLVRSTDEQPANVLVTALAAWTEFATHAAEVRLRPLRFAVASGGRVLVRGLPAPPLPGRRFVERAGLAVPAGYSWSPRVSLEVLCHLFGATDQALVVWESSESFMRLHVEQFVPATRGAARVTAAEAALDA